MKLDRGLLMRRRVFRQSYMLVGVGILTLWPSVVNARLTKRWDLKIIADEAEALVAGEVQEVKTVSQRRWCVGDAPYKTTSDEGGSRFDGRGC